MNIGHEKFDNDTTKGQKSHVGDRKGKKWWKNGEANSEIRLLTTMGTKFMGFGYLEGGILKGFSFPSGTTAFGLLYC